ncbi:hypothetical protein BOX15_Mlig015056g3 [Macrostomum lignano]|uniref:Mitochondrial proton/calcium exchanger protein n=2 Tax=Macrostomum lignano TaxID=282301 RepID=A0A1I8GZ24_9PLAT|nr:hypothetical protein BOX15_Mlig015056g3 [Macrostomum lignano]
MHYVVFSGSRICFQRLYSNAILSRQAACISQAASSERWQWHQQQRLRHQQPLLLNRAQHPIQSQLASVLLIRGLHSSCCHRTGDEIKNKPPPPASPPAKTQSQPPTARPSLPARIWHEILHYWNGFRLLALETRIALRISLKYMRGATISRRERRHLVRTVADLFRMVPFLFFIVIPFMEFLLPFYLKFMPFMLPSTFKEKDKEAEKLRIKLKAKLETAKFLQETLYEGFQAKTTDKSNREALADFRRFMQKCTTASRYATTDELLRFSALFADELTLDNLERPQLMAICKLLDMAAVGSKAMILLQLELRLRQLHTDDLMIRDEGVDRLNVTELQAACRARGMPALGVSEDRLREQLSQWLDLHLVHSVPVSLLLLSRLLHFPDSVDAEERLRKVIGSLPEQAIRSAEASSSEADSRTRLEALKSRDRAIRSEEAEIKKTQKQKKKHQQEEVADVLTTADSAERLRDPAEAAGATTGRSATAAGDAASDGADIDVGAADLQALESAIDEVSAKALDEEEIRELKEELSEYFSGLADAPIVGDVRRERSKEEKRAAKLLSAKVDRLLHEMDGMFDKVYSEKEALERRLHKAERDQAELSNDAAESSVDDATDMERQLAKQIAKHREQVLSMNDILLALRRLQKMPDDDKWERILQVLDEDKDGKIEVQHVVKVIELLGSENLRLSSRDLTKLLETLDKEKLLSLKGKDKDKDPGRKLLD